MLYSTLYFHSTTVLDILLNYTYLTTIITRLFSDLILTFDTFTLFFKYSAFNQLKHWFLAILKCDPIQMPISVVNISIKEALTPNVKLPNIFSTF